MLVRTLLRGRAMSTGGGVVTCQHITDTLPLHSSLTLRAWVKSVRAQKQAAFIVLNDGSDQHGVQVVCDPAMAKGLSTGCSVEVTGVLQSSQGKGQSKEILASGVKLVGPVDESYPLQKKHTTMEFLRTLPHLRARSNTFGAVLRMRSAASQSIHSYFQEQGFLNVHTPLITSLDCEGAGELFSVKTPSDMAVANTNANNNTPSTEQSEAHRHFFGSPAFLTVSGQLHAEMFACAMSKVYTFGPTFRAEKSQTNRHLSEFWMVEPEVAYASLDDVCSLAEGMLRRVIADMFKHRLDDLQFFNERVDKQLIERLNGYVARPFVRMTYTEAVKVLQASNVPFQFPVEWGQSLQTEHEKWLAAQYCKRPVFVTDYPKDIKSFYMKQNADGKTVAATDLLLPGMGELIGGSAREDDHDKLKRRMIETNMDLEPYQWYLDLRKFGSVPHGGFGLGFERLIQCLSGLDNIRDVSLVPRHIGSCKL